MEVFSREDERNVCNEEEKQLTLRLQKNERKRKVVNSLRAVDKAETYTTKKMQEKEKERSDHQTI